jgi:hypothetical protein
MAAMRGGYVDETAEWLNHLQPEGLVVGGNILRERVLTPIRQTPLDTEEAREALGLPLEVKREEDKHFVLHDAWTFFERVLGWPARLVAGARGGPDVDKSLVCTLPEHSTLLEPDMALLWRPGDETEPGVPVQALVLLHPTLDADNRNQFGDDEWEASPHQRLERLLRETGIGVGILVARNVLRLVYAPRGETAGWMDWPLAALGRVEGRPMLAGLKLCLDKNAFFTGAPEARLRPLLRASREAQNEVSEKLSGQVLGALHELLRGLYRADADRIEALAENDPHHLYEGLLTCLMRLVFLLYAEDRDLLPTHTEGGLKTLWESGYSIKSLYQRLLTDEAVNPDTMDGRFGGWGQLLAVFRLIHGGHPDWVAKRGGKLFDPDVFPFLEGRDNGSTRDDARVMPMSDGALLRILHGLMTIDGRGLNGERVRERLSYRSLDVESIGSVYETVMGFTAKRAREPMIALRDEKKLPAFVGLESLLAQKPSDRQKWLKEQSIKPTTAQLNAVKAATDIQALIAGFGSLVDERGSPKSVSIGAGAPYLLPTEERRRSGSHYTPRSLTEPIVRHALEPAFDRIGENASPEAVLSLKVLDPACGSGAFLVEACRQLGARLEQAWDMHEAERPTNIPPDEDVALHARRLVAQRCIYGVDRNPMAVDLARLSLWLVTLAREHEFTFLDHAIKAGDSLVGLTQHEIEAANWDAGKPSLPYVRILLKDRLQRVLDGREAIRTAPDDVTRAVQQSRHDRIEDQLEAAREIGDAVIYAFFSADKSTAREAERQKIESLLAAPIGVDQSATSLAARRFRAERGWRPFHWQIEFPEVFSRESPGFDAIVGNPPFAGKNTIAAASGAHYLPWLQHLHKGAHGNADLVAHFFRRAFNLLRPGGAFGLIATNTIGQGDTRETGLAAILGAGGSIYRTVKRYQWPNEGAAVVVSIVHVAKRDTKSQELNGRPVSRISAYLVAGQLDGAPERLDANAGRSFQGVILLGMGFTFDDVAAAKGEAENLETMRALIASEPRNAQRIRPYIGGEELNNSPVHAHHRYAIDFANFPRERVPSFKSWFSWSEDRKREGLKEGRVPVDYPRPVAEDWPDLLAILEARVRPERLKQTDGGGRRFWWRFLRPRMELRAAAAGLEYVWTLSRVSPQLGIARLSSQVICADSMIVFAYSNFSPFAVLQSRVHEIWARFFSSTLEDRLRYAPSDCFETFPFPSGYETDATLEAIGQTYHDHRAQLMVAADEGLTKTYNRFHKREQTGPAIQRLRDLHDEMDRAVLRAYGWDSLAETLKPEFLTIESEDDHTYQGRYFWPAAQRDLVLSRLLALNAERYTEEVAAGVHDKGKKPTRDDEDGEFELKVEE